jgi:hypothetical protein
MTEAEDLPRQVREAIAVVRGVLPVIRRVRKVDPQLALEPTSELADALQDVVEEVREERRGMLIEIRDQTALSLAVLGQRIGKTRARVDQIIKAPSPRRAKGTGEDSDG